MIRKLLFIIVFIGAGLTYYFWRQQTLDNQSVRPQKNLQVAKNLRQKTKIKQDPYRNRSLEEVKKDEAEAKKVESLKANREARKKIEENEIVEMERDEFEGLLRKTFSQMPLKKDLRKSSAGEIHSVPSATMEAGHRLGKIKKILLKRPEFIPQGIKNYRNCASKNDIPTSIRALCLTNLVQFKKQQGETVDLKAYPKEVVRLAKLAMEL